MQENVVIEFSSDTTKLPAAIDLLEKMGAITAEQAAAARKMGAEYKAQQDAIASGTRASVSEVEKFAGAYKNLVSKVTNGAIDNTFKDIVAAMHTVNPEAAKLYEGLSDVKDAEAFVAQTTKLLKQQLSQLAAEGKKDTAEYQGLSTAIDKLEKEVSELSNAPKPDVSPEGEEKVVSARTRLRELREELMSLEDAGEVDTDKFRKLAEEAGNLTDQIGDTQDIINYLGSDTKGLDALNTGMSGLVGGFNLATSAGALLGGESEKLQEAFYKVQAAMSAVNGAMAVANALNKTSPLIRGIVYIQTLAAAKATNLQTAATGKATIAQRLFNLVAKANPYVLLAMAIITVVGAIAALVMAQDSEIKKQKELNKLREAELEALKLRAESINREAERRVGDIDHEMNLVKKQGELEIAMARDESERAKAEAVLENNLIALEQKRLDAQRQAHNERKENAARDLRDLNANTKALKENEELLAKIKDEIGQGFDGTFNIGMGIRGIDAETAVDLVQERIDKLGESVKIATEIVVDEQKLNETQEEINARALKFDAEQKKKRIELAKQAAKEELEIRRQAIDLSIKLIDDEKTRRVAEVSENFRRQKEDLEKRRAELKKDGLLTAQAQKDINTLLVNLDKQKNNDLDAIAAEFEKKRLAEIRASQDIELSLLPEGFDKRRELTEKEYDRQIKDLKIRLATEKNLTLEQQKRINADIINLTKKREKELAAISKEEDMRLHEDIAQADLDALEERYDTELVELSKMYAQKLIKEEDYNRRKDEIQRKYADDSIQIEMDRINGQLQIVEKGTDEEKELLRQLAEEQKRLAKEKADAEIAEHERSAKKREEREKAVKDAWKELQSAAFDMANELSQMYFDNENARLEQQLADLDKFYTTDAEEAAKNKNLKLVSEEELARKQAEIKNKQAAAEKQAAYIQAVINAAKAITQVFASTSPPASFILAGITAAATAIQIAKIASSPVPKYAKGRKGGRGEYALTGERGPEIMWIPEGASIIPAHKSKKLMEGMRIAGEYKVPFSSVPSFSNIDVAGLQDARYTFDIDYDRLGRSVAKNIPQAPEIRQLNVNMDENGFTKFLAEKTGRTAFLNSRF
ncbi:MAG: hypothetical protein LBF39_02025 [Prevotellaceae bacterium]|jgi:hypothetical protein|nr:hypothetical protein [Prevotellaceae bacterium]